MTLLFSCNTTTIYRSYKAIDLSMVIGIVLGVIVLFILCCVINCYRFRRCCFRRKYTPPSTRNIIVLDYQEKTLSDYRFNLYPAVKIYPSQTPYSSTSYYPQPSAPSYPIPSAPPSYPIPSAPSYPMPSAPPANL